MTSVTFHGQKSPTSSRMNKINLTKLNYLNFMKLAELAMGFGGSCFINFLSIMRKALDIVSSALYGFVHRNKSEPLPPLTNLILLDSATDLAAKIRIKKLKSQEIIESYIARIKEVNPIINAMVDFNFDKAMEEAKKVDELIASGNKTAEEIERETPFLGVPFTTKDCMQVQGLHQTIGLVSRKDKISDSDAEAVALMRKAGAIILGVTNVSEACMWWESSNYVYGTTNNPYNTTRIVGGSSGGEGALIAAAGSVIGIGSDIGGSIRMPAFFNGIFGHKPSSGIVSNHGQLPEAMGDLQTFLTTGPMCRFASDLLPMLKILASSNIDKLHLDKPVNIQSLNFYYMENDGGSPLISKIHPDIYEAMNKVIYYLDKAHSIKAQNHKFNKLKHSLEMWSQKLGGAESPSFCEHLVERKGKLNAPLELLKWCFWCSSHTLPAILLGVFEKFSGKETPNYAKSINMCKELQREFSELLGDNGVFLYPTHPRPAPYHNQPILMPFNFAYTAIINVLEFPATHIPLGLSKEGVPIGIQVVANKYNDHLCLAVARELEKAFGGWVSPSAIL